MIVTESNSIQFNCLDQDHTKGSHDQLRNLSRITFQIGSNHMTACMSSKKSNRQMFSMSCLEYLELLIS